jgi:hypothetical protein
MQSLAHVVLAAAAGAGVASALSASLTHPPGRSQRRGTRSRWPFPSSLRVPRERAPRIWRTIVAWRGLVGLEVARSAPRRRGSGSAALRTSASTSTGTPRPRSSPPRGPRICRSSSSSSVRTASSLAASAAASSRARRGERDSRPPSRSRRIDQRPIEALPVNGRLQIREEDSRSEHDGR